MITLIQVSSLYFHVQECSSRLILDISRGYHELEGFYDARNLPEVIF